MALTTTQRTALDRINRDGVLYPYNGVRTDTVRALAKLNLIELEMGEPVKVYGSLGSRGHRGQWCQTWTARPRD